MQRPADLVREHEIELARVGGSELHGVLGLGAAVIGQSRHESPRERDAAPRPCRLRLAEDEPPPIGRERALDRHGASLEVEILPAHGQGLAGATARPEQEVEQHGISVAPRLLAKPCDLVPREGAHLAVLLLGQIDQ